MNGLPPGAPLPVNGRPPSGTSPHLLELLGTPPAKDEPELTHCEVRIHTLRRLLQLLGGCVSILFATQGVRLLVNYEVPATVWQLCHWIGEGALCVIAGLCGCYLELRIFFPDVAKSRRLFALNRLGLAFGYIWVGCYTMGGHVQEGAENWKTLGRITGILAWVVCAGDICIACCSDREDPAAPPPEDPEKNTFDQQDAPEEVEYCKNCGTAKSTGYKFCPTCGARFPGGDGAAADRSPVRIIHCGDKSNPFAQDAAAFAAMTTRGGGGGGGGRSPKADAEDQDKSNPFGGGRRRNRGDGSPTVAPEPAGGLTPKGRARFLQPLESEIPPSPRGAGDATGKQGKEVHSNESDISDDDFGGFGGLGGGK